MIGQPYDEVIIMTDSRYKHYKANEDRVILNDGLLFRKKIGETGTVKYCQILIPKQLLNEGLHSLHGEYDKHTFAYREKHYFPN